MVESSSIEYDAALEMNKTFSDPFDYDNDNDIDMETDDEAFYDDANGISDSEDSSTSSSSTIASDLSDIDSDNLNFNDPDEIDSGAYEDEHHDDHIYADTMSVNRFQSKEPIRDLPETESYSTLSTVTSTQLLTSYLWPRFLSKPAIVVGIIGSVVVGLLAGIILIMFIIYRMRKKDEGSYVLDEGPIKSPSHTYTRVSSREFFA